MISVTPQGSIYLCKTPLINDYKNQLTFSNLTSQLNYFNSRIQKTFDNYTYIKKDNVIKVGENIDTIIGCNYLFYRNNGFTNKYYFCFITNMEYINENCTAITIETDCFQTYQFDISYKPCFVEREHVNDDTIGLHTIDENLETGELIADRTDELNELTTGRWNWIVIACNYDPAGTGTSRSGACMYDGILQGNQLFAWLYDSQSATDVSEKVDSIANWIRSVDSAGHGSDITAIYIAPGNAIASSSVDATTHRITATTLTGIQRVNEKTKAQMRAFEDFTPKNNRLYCYPYSFIRISNNVGNYNDYHIEDFSGVDCNFSLIGVLCVGYSGKLRPINYRGVEYNEDEGLTLGKYPTCSWSNDSYTNWLTQNAVNLGYDMVRNIANVGVNAATGNIVGASMNIVGAVASHIGQHRQAMMQPNTAKGNANAGDVSFTNRLLTFKREHLRPKIEYLQIIDEYLSAYGYKCNRFKIPNITGRTNWNYVKTLECNFTGDNIPQTELNVIRTMFNNGVTLWHNSATMLDYSQSNAIV